MKLMRIIRFLLCHKNKQVFKEREEKRMLQSENSILSAYLAILIERAEELRIPKETVSEMIGNYRAYVRAEGEDYVITLERSTDRKELYGK